ncbi:uncharacterized protein LOC111454527 isoform X1 [Cucurbita moschata]|uniref:Uncharacterized protein LOC111454527 isoform X1 n=1 Tax=Cucurbita moschata TaxID=3662 RepID=A0A6J1GJW2_CUCMO|nr:uncharacterized protein LOC111454527 isoform X1 [Cucurbita moschata]
MATLFRPNLKWSFQIQAHCRRSSSSKASPDASKGREASFGSGRLSFFSSICEEGEFISRDTFKTYTCLSEAPQTSADNLLDLKEIEINNKARPLGHLHYGLKCTRPSRVDDNFSAGMLSLGRDGQNDLAIEDGGYHNVNPKTDGQNDDVVVYSGKRAGRRSGNRCRALLHEIQGWSLTKAMNQIQKARKALNNGSNRYSDDDIAKATGLPLAKVRLANNCLKVVGSIDQKRSDGLNMKSMEFAADTSIQSPEETVKRKLMKIDILIFLKGWNQGRGRSCLCDTDLSISDPSHLRKLGNFCT